MTTMEVEYGNRSSAQDEREAGQRSGQSGLCRAGVYYFCSEACHKAFAAEPQKYAGKSPHGGGSHHHGHKYWSRPPGGVEETQPGKAGFDRGESCTNCWFNAWVMLSPLD